MKSKFNFIMIALVFVILFVFVFSVEGIDKIVDIIQTVNPWWLLVALVCMILYWALESGILYIITKNTGVPCKLKDIVEISMLGQLFNCITPFASGGQPMQAYHMAKKEIPLATATASLMGKFIVYQLTLIVYCTVLLIAKFSYFTTNVSGFTYLTLVGYLVNFSVMAFFFAIIYFNKPTSKLIQWFTKLLVKMRIIKHSEQLYQRIDEGVNNFSIGFFSLMKDKKLVFRSFLYTILQLTVYMLIPYFLLLAFGLPNVSIVTMIAAQAFVMSISSFMPLPGGSGAAEGSFYIFFSLFFGPTTGVAMLLWRGITYYLTMFVGAGFSIHLSFSNKKTLKAEATEVTPDQPES